MNRRVFAVAVFGFLALASTSASSQERDVYVPEDLEPWRQWVLEDLSEIRCPFFMNSTAGVPVGRVCGWPGRLEIDAQADNATFRQTWRLRNS